MAINLQNAAGYIHGSPASQLDGLYAAVKAKCDELGLVPGKRDNMASDGTLGSVNARGFLSFVEGIQPLPAEYAEYEAEVAKGKLLETDSPAVVMQKQDIVAQANHKKQLADNARKQTQADHDALRKLLGTLNAKFASCGYTPK